MDLKTAIELADEFGAWLFDDDCLADWEDGRIVSNCPNLTKYKRNCGSDLTDEFLSAMSKNKRASEIPADMETIRFIIQIFEMNPFRGVKSQSAWDKTLRRLKMQK